MIPSLLAVVLIANSAGEVIKKCREARTAEIELTGDHSRAQENYIRCLDRG